jgi:hypothetical protein
MLIGETGRVRIGQSQSIEERVIHSARENTACLGKVQQVKVLKRERNRRRLAYERKVILTVRQNFPELNCNKTTW